MPIEDTAGSEALESALGGMFEEPKAPAKPAPIRADPLPDTPEGDELAAAEVMGEEAEQIELEPAGPEPEFEIEVEGVRETVRGEAQIKEMLQKAVHFSRNSEQNARIREALVAQANAQQNQMHFQQAVMVDVAEYQSLASQLKEYDKVDWAAAIDSDFVGVMKLKEQQAQIKSKLDAKAQEIGAKQQYFQQSQAQAAQQIFAAEAQALVAKLPEWRNSEKAQSEKQAIAKELGTYYGFNAAEIGSLMDHRMVMVARDAAAYRALQAGKAERLKQVRAAPPAVRPGTASTQQTSRTDFVNARMELRKLGQQGKSHAQEALVTKMLNKAFK